MFKEKLKQNVENYFSVSEGGRRSLLSGTRVFGARMCVPNAGRYLLPANEETASFCGGALRPPLRGVHGDMAHCRL